MSTITAPLVSVPLGDSDQVDLESAAKSKVTIWSVIALALGGGGYMATPTDIVYDVLDERYWTIAQQNLEVEFAIEDEIASLTKEIAAKVLRGEDTTDDLVRIGVLKDRLRRMREEP